MAWMSLKYEVRAIIKCNVWTSSQMIRVRVRAHFHYHRAFYRQDEVSNAIPITVPPKWQFADSLCLHQVHSICPHSSMCSLILDQPLHMRPRRAVLESFSCWVGYLSAAARYNLWRIELRFVIGWVIVDVFEERSGWTHIPSHDFNAPSWWHRAGGFIVPGGTSSISCTRTELQRKSPPCSSVVIICTSPVSISSHEHCNS